MNQLWIVPLSVACFVLAVDMIITYLRRRVRNVSQASELLDEESLGGIEDERVATDPK